MYRNMTAQCRSVDFPPSLENVTAVSTKRESDIESEDDPEKIGICASSIDDESDTDLELKREWRYTGQSRSSQVGDHERHRRRRRVSKSNTESSDSNLMVSTEMHDKVHLDGRQSNPESSTIESVVDRDAVSENSVKQATSDVPCSTLDESVDRERTSSSNETEGMEGGMEGLDDGRGGVRVADWISAPPIRKLSVRFTPSAESQLAEFWHEENKCEFTKIIQRTDFKCLNLLCVIHGII